MLSAVALNSKFKFKTADSFGLLLVPGGERWPNVPDFSRKVWIGFGLKFHSGRSKTQNLKKLDFCRQTLPDKSARSTFALAVVKRCQGICELKDKRTSRKAPGETFCWERKKLKFCF